MVHKVALKFHESNNIIKKTRCGSGLPLNIISGYSIQVPLNKTVSHIYIDYEGPSCIKRKIGAPIWSPAAT